MPLLQAETFPLNRCGSPHKERVSAHLWGEQNFVAKSHLLEISNKGKWEYRFFLKTSPFSIILIIELGRTLALLLRIDRKGGRGFHYLFSFRVYLTSFFYFLYAVRKDQ